MTAVDYLSHNFNEFDLHQCWRNATKNKDSLINGRRLENASWRKFFQLKFALKTISPAHLNWNKDGDVNWLYGPFHTYEPLIQLQAAAARAAAQAQDVDPADISTHPHAHNHLKPALKAPVGDHIRDWFLGMRASSDPDLVSSSLQNTVLPRTTQDFGATKMGLKSQFEKQAAALAPLTGRKADFFLASAAERAAQRSKLLGAGTGFDRSTSDVGSLDSFNSSGPGSPLVRTIRFADDSAASIPHTKAKVVGFNPSHEEPSSSRNVAGAGTSAVVSSMGGFRGEEEMGGDIYVSQPQRKLARFGDSSSDEDDSDEDDKDKNGSFGLSFHGSKRSLLTTTQPVLNATAVSPIPSQFDVPHPALMPTNSGGGLLQRTSSHEKGLYKLSSLSSAISASSKLTSSSSPMARTASFEKGLSKLSDWK